MKKILVGFIFIVYSALLNAQPYHPFPNDSAQWSVIHVYSSPFSASSCQYKMKGDTILNGKSYKKIYCSNELNYGSVNQTLHCFIREDGSKKVFAKYPTGAGVDTAEFVIYDFNLSVGDTIETKLFYYTTDSIFKFVVTFIDTSTTLIDIRRCINLEPVAPLVWGGGCDYQYNWIEGIGSILGPFYYEIPQNACISAYYYLNCYWENGNYILGGTFCDPITNIDFEELNTNLKIKPNPVTDISILELRGKEFNIMEIYNILGVKIKTIEINNLEQVVIKKIDFSDGLYVYKLCDSRRQLMTGIFLVQ